MQSKSWLEFAATQDWWGKLGYRNRQSVQWLANSDEAGFAGNAAAQENLAALLADDEARTAVMSVINVMDQDSEMQGLVAILAYPRCREVMRSLGAVALFDQKLAYALAGDPVFRTPDGMGSFDSVMSNPDSREWVMSAARSARGGGYDDWDPTQRRGFAAVVARPHARAIFADLAAIEPRPTSEFAAVTRQLGDAGAANFAGLLDDRDTRRMFFRMLPELGQDHLGKLGAELADPAAAAGRHGITAEALAGLTGAETTGFILHRAAAQQTSPGLVRDVLAAINADPAGSRYLIAMLGWSTASPQPRVTLAALSNLVAVRHDRPEHSGLSTPTMHAALAGAPAVGQRRLIEVLGTAVDTDPDAARRLVEVLSGSDEPARHAVIAAVSGARTPEDDASILAALRLPPAQAHAAIFDVAKLQTFTDVASAEQLDYEIDQQQRRLDRLRNQPIAGLGSDEIDAQHQIIAAAGGRLDALQHHREFLRRAGILEKSFADENVAIPDADITASPEFPQRLRLNPESERHMLTGGPGRNYTGILNWKTGEIFLRALSPNMPPKGTPVEDGGRYPGIPRDWGGIETRADMPLHAGPGVPAAVPFDPHVHGPGRRSDGPGHLDLAKHVCADHPEMSIGDFVGFTLRTGHGVDFGTDGPKKIGITGFRWRSRSLTEDVITNSQPARTNGHDNFTTGVLSQTFANGISEFLYRTVGRSQERVELDRLNQEDLANGSTYRNTIDNLSPEFRDKMTKLDLAAAQQQRASTRERTFEAETPTRKHHRQPSRQPRTIDEPVTPQEARHLQRRWEATRKQHTQPTDPNAKPTP